jgi:hypothetical protein
MLDIWETKIMVCMVFHNQLPPAANIIVWMVYHNQIQSLVQLLQSGKVLNFASSAVLVRLETFR